MKKALILISTFLLLIGCATNSHNQPIYSEIQKVESQKQPCLLVFLAPSIDHFKYGTNAEEVLRDQKGTLVYKCLIHDFPYSFELSELGLPHLMGELNVTNGKYLDSVNLNGTNKGVPYHASAKRFLGRADITSVYIRKFTKHDDLWFILTNLN